MTFEVHKKDGYSELRTEDGQTIAEIQHPIHGNEDFIDPILDYHGVEGALADALSTILRHDWEFVHPDE